MKKDLRAATFNGLWPQSPRSLKIQKRALRWKPSKMTSVIHYHENYWEVPFLDPFGGVS